MSSNRRRRKQSHKDRHNYNQKRPNTDDQNPDYSEQDDVDEHESQSANNHNQGHTIEIPSFLPKPSMQRGSAREFWSALPLNAAAHIKQTFGIDNHVNYVEHEESKIIKMNNKTHLCCAEFLHFLRCNESESLPNLRESELELDLESTLNAERIITLSTGSVCWNCRESRTLIPGYLKSDFQAIPFLQREREFVRMNQTLNVKLKHLLKGITPTFTAQSFADEVDQSNVILDAIKPLIRSNHIQYNDDDELVMVGQVPFQNRPENKQILLFITIIKGFGVLHINLKNSIPRHLKSPTVSSVNVAKLIKRRHRSNVNFTKVCTYTQCQCSPPREVYESLIQIQMF